MPAATDAEPKGQAGGDSAANAAPAEPVSSGPEAAPAAPPITADLAFAVKLAPPETGQTSAGQTSANQNPANQNPANQNNDAAQDKAGATEDATAATPQTPSRISADAVTAVKDAHRTEQDADAPAAPPPPAQAQAPARAVTVFQAPEKAASPDATPAAAEPQRLDASKALNAEPVQTQAATAATRPAGPLKDLSVQVGQTQQDRVELRVVERSGELQVAVRAADPELAQGLRQGLSDLADRLEQNGFRAETWRPGTAVSTVATSADARQKSTQFQDNGSQPQSGGSRQGRQQNGQNQSSRPRWVQELEGSLAGAGTASTGESNGLIR